MTPASNKPAAPAQATPSAAVAGGIGAMAVCCTLTLLIAAGALGAISGAAIFGIAAGAGIAIAAAVWLSVVWLHRRKTSSDAGCCTTDTSEPPAYADHHARRDGP